MGLTAKFDILRSHWNNGDFVWLANVRLNDAKVQSAFCYFRKGIDKNVIDLFSSPDRQICLKILLPEELTMMSDSRIIQYLELELVK